ncbi:MAG TPA: hypothetical protein VJ866_12035 [Pyrinomonadaceae bacterium]|nr:hypothetical protein [Pyrinomonadaceae bacterium]
MFEPAGSRSPGLAALNNLDCRLSYKHSNEPAGANRLREGTLSFQAFGASRPLGTNGVILRYGAGRGVRLSGFNFNTTVGYAFNLRRRPGDGRGALFFSMDFTDIFRR